MTPKNTGRLVLRLFGILCAVYGMALPILNAGADMVPIWLILGVLCIGLSLRKPFEFVFSRKWVRILLSAGIAIVLIFECVLVAEGYGSAPAEVSDYIIVLGAKVNGEVPSRSLQYRLDAALQYLNAHDTVKAILSGGQGSNEGISEAEAMRRYLSARGIGGERLILEDRSTSTVENLRYSFQLLGDQKNLNICIVTSDFHVLRAKLIAAKLGRHVSGIGAKTYLPFIPNYYLRELFGVIHDMICF